MKNSSLSQTAIKKVHPGRLLLPGCAVAAGLLTVRPVLAQETPVAPAASKPAGAVMTLVLGKTANLPLAEGASYVVEEGGDLVTVTSQNGTLNVKALAAGKVRVRIDAPNRKPQYTTLRLMDAVSAYIERRAQSQVVDRAATDTTASAPAPAVGTAGTAVAQGLDSTAAAPPLPALAPVEPAPSPAPAPAVATEPSPAPAVSAPPLDASGARVVTPDAPPELPKITRVQSTTASGTAPRISPSLPPPAMSSPARVTYRTTPNLPKNVNGRSARSSIMVGQGLARLLTFRDNILAVFFSDPAVMDARAINARTIAVTGVAPGPSTLAVFTQRYPGDAIGQANIYRVDVAPRAGSQAPVDTRTPAEVQTSIESALNDPRIRVSAFQLPDGSLAVRLTGGLRSDAEVQGATNTASFFVPRVISSLYVDPNAQTLDQAQANVGFGKELSDEELQTNLRRITGNDTLELIALPNSYVLKGEAESIEDAQRILHVIPSLNKEVTPYLVIRGVDNAQNPVYGQTIPLLKGEDRQLTERLQAVTGLRTVYAVRTSANGMAVYGSVRTRAEYESVRRLAQIMAQVSAPGPTPGTSQGGTNVQPTGTELRLSAYAPEGGYRYPTGIQLFVRILNPSEATIRQVTISTDIVEITRTAAKNLGVQYGSATLTNETIAADGTVTRTVNPNFNSGFVVGGNGFGGTGGFGMIDPFRARLDALYKSGNARVLSRPNVTAVEGMPARITVGGERPIPRAVAAGSGAVGTDIEFRRFGIILTLRPTVTDDNSIILQIRADITAIDTTTSITVGGATIPGETERSVNTTLTVRPGDILVLGGLVTNERRVNTSKIPFLGDIPVLGSLFQSRSFENNQTELAIFMTPQITTIPATVEGWEKVMRAPGYPDLPAQNESNSLFTSTPTGG